MLTSPSLVTLSTTAFSQSAFSAHKTISNMKSVVAAAATLALATSVSARTFTVVNKCSYTVWPGVRPFRSVQPLTSSGMLMNRPTALYRPERRYCRSHPAHRLGAEGRPDHLLHRPRQLEGGPHLGSPQLRLLHQPRAQLLLGRWLQRWPLVRQAQRHRRAPRDRRRVHLPGRRQPRLVRW